MAIYFLIRWTHQSRYYTAYASGISIFHIPYFYECEIARYVSANQYVNLTPHLVSLQRRIRHRVALLRWLRHPERIRYRETHGRWPPIPRSLYHHR